MEEQIRESVRATIEASDDINCRLSRSDVYESFLDTTGCSHLPNFRRAENKPVIYHEPIKIPYTIEMERYEIEALFDFEGSYLLFKEGLDTQEIHKTFKMKYMGYISGYEIGMIKNPAFKILEVR